MARTADLLPGTLDIAVNPVLVAGDFAKGIDQRQVDDDRARRAEFLRTGRVVLQVNS